MALADNQSVNPPPVKPNYLCQNIYRLPAGEDDIRSVDNSCLVELAVLIRQVIEEDVGDPAK